MLAVTILMVLVSHMVLLINISGHLYVDLWLQAFSLMVEKATVPVLKVVDHSGQLKWDYLYTADYNSKCQHISFKYSSH